MQGGTLFQRKAEVVDSDRLSSHNAIRQIFLLVMLNRI
jgi:hypothetical protein